MTHCTQEYVSLLQRKESSETQSNLCKVPQLAINLYLVTFPLTSKGGTRFPSKDSKDLSGLTFDHGKAMPSPLPLWWSLEGIAWDRDLFGHRSP